MKNPKLILEILGGPLDGLTVALEAGTEWSSAGDGLLSFPWDEELGTPQARFFIKKGGWWLEGHDAPHGTYCVSRGERVEGETKLETGNVLKASDTWLLVKETE